MGAFTGCVATVSFGDYYKDRIKSNLKKNTDKYELHPKNWTQFLEVQFFYVMNCNK